MTYKDRFVVEVKLNGKILRVKDDCVYLPFGSEYSLYLKNLNSRRASVNISIDGQDVLDGNSLIIDGNSSFELEGFLDGSTARNKFKFIQKTKQIQDYRGDKIDDGLVRVEFAFEKPRFKGIVFGGCSFDGRVYTYHNDYMRSIAPPTDVFYSSNVNVGHSLLNEDNSAPQQDEGITVKGSEVHQSFMETYVGDLEDSEVIVIQMKGQTESTKTEVKKPITVKTRLTCKTCGKRSSSRNKYCPNCGTFLE